METLVNLINAAEKSDPLLFHMQKHEDLLGKMLATEADTASISTKLKEITERFAAGGDVETAKKAMEEFSHLERLKEGELNVDFETLEQLLEPHGLISVSLSQCMMAIFFDKSMHADGCRCSSTFGSPRVQSKQVIVKQLSHGP